MIARLNKACELVSIHDSELNASSVVNAYVGKKASRFLVGSKSEKDFYPYEKLFENLAETIDGPIFSADVAVLNVSMKFNVAFNLAQARRSVTYDNSRISSDFANRI